MASNGDGLDDLLHEISMQKTASPPGRSGNEGLVTFARGEATNAEVAEDDGWDDWDEASSQPQEDVHATTKHVNAIAEQLRNYIHDVADSAVRESVNQELSHISFRKFLQYYQESEQLAEYTIKTELPRMMFSVIHHGHQTDSKQQIEDIFDETPFEDIWRMANQSIFADMLVALQRRYLRADLSISIVSTASSFTIDLDSNKLQALSVFHITVPSNGGKTRLQLCSFAATIDVDLKSRVLKQRIGPPDLAFVFDEQILDAAETIDMYTHNPQHGPLIEVDLQKAREQLLAVRKQLTTAGEGLLEGVVGSLGRIVGADQQHGRRDSNAASVDKADDTFRLYRRDEEAHAVVAPSAQDAGLSLERNRSATSTASEGQHSASSSPSAASYTATPTSGGLFGTWFKVAEKVASVGQLGVQFALAVGEEVAKAAAQQAHDEGVDSEELEGTHQRKTDEDFRFPRPARETPLDVAAHCTLPITQQQVSPAASNHDAAHDRSPSETSDQSEAESTMDDTIPVQAANTQAEREEASAAAAAADNESSDGEIAEEDAW